MKICPAWATDYTVIGDVVNTAKRLQSVAQAGQIFITEASFKLVKESFQFEEVGSFQLKNKAEPALLYQVLA